mmetsp:Transcript_3271/g.11304  ORF Transcript_3271/g.11304 Transcript_3271/m.11304 type:complete len:287 (+) Transcript_3271:818-1678(+)
MNRCGMSSCSSTSASGDVYWCASTMSARWAPFPLPPSPAPRCASDDRPPRTRSTVSSASARASATTRRSSPPCIATVGTHESTSMAESSTATQPALSWESSASAARNAVVGPVLASRSTLSTSEEGSGASWMAQSNSAPLESATMFSAESTTTPPLDTVMTIWSPSPSGGMASTRSYCRLRASTTSRGRPAAAALARLCVTRRMPTSGLFALSSSSSRLLMPERVVRRCSDRVLNLALLSAARMAVTHWSHSCSDSARNTQRVWSDVSSSNANGSSSSCTVTMSVR